MLHIRKFISYFSGLPCHWPSQLMAISFVCLCQWNHYLLGVHCSLFTNSCYCYDLINERVGEQWTLGIRHTNSWLFCLIIQFTYSWDHRKNTISIYKLYSKCIDLFSLNSIERNRKNSWAILMETQYVISIILKTKTNFEWHPIREN